LEGKDKKPTIDFINRRSYSYSATISRYLSDTVTFYEYGASVFSSPAYESGVGNGTANEAANAAVGLLLASALAHTETVLGLVSDLKTEPNESRAFPPLVIEARERVLAALSDHRLTVAQIADWLSCSSDYLSHLFKTATGESLTEYTQRSRLERAKDLLKDSELSVKEISWACGFSEESYFIRKFKDRFGLSPGLYRRS
jgi:AraC-like DNA-binding protein